MRERAIEFARYGGIIFKENDFINLAKSSLMPVSLISKLIDRMLIDGDDAPAFLEIVEKNTFALASSFSDVQKFLINGAKKEIKGSKGEIKKEKWYKQKI